MKFERSAQAKNTPAYAWIVMRPLLILSLLAGLAVTFLAYREERAQRIIHQEQSERYDKRIHELYGWNLSLEQRLEEMTKAAGAHRAYGVYHDCVQQNLGIYQMKDVARAYERHFRSTELTKRCLAESAWYETHPIGNNPDHLHH